MSTRPNVNVPTPKAVWMPRPGRPIRTLGDQLMALTVAAAIATALFLFL
jgi:hypothetical protein